jgi:hypothetical protein
MHVRQAYRCCQRGSDAVIQPRFSNPATRNRSSQQRRIRFAVDPLFEQRPQAGMSLLAVEAEQPLVP